jgi:hypothetical protein
MSFTNSARLSSVVRFWLGYNRIRVGNTEGESSFDPARVALACLDGINNLQGDSFCRQIGLASYLEGTTNSLENGERQFDLLRVKRWLIGTVGATSTSVMAA